MSRYQLRLGNPTGYVVYDTLIERVIARYATRSTAKGQATRLNGVIRRAERAARAAASRLKKS